MYKLAGKDVTIWVSFQVNGDPAIPDVGSVTYTLRDHLGVEMTGQTDVPVTTDATTTGVSITLPASANTITQSLERRTLVVNWTKGGAPQVIRIPYWLHNWLNHSVTPDQVRSFIGINRDELPDEEIDLVRAYFKVEDLLTKTVLENALSGDPRETQLAEDAILAQAVLDLSPSLKARTAQRLTDGTIGFDRPKIDDFDLVMSRAREMLEAAISELTGSSTDTPIVIFGVRPDAITGA